MQTEAQVHDANHSPIPQMAQAGFVYTPGHPGDDSVACYYCGTALNGWDEDDDPMLVALSADSTTLGDRYTLARNTLSA